MTEYNENVTDEQNAAVEENFEGEYTATDAVNEEFVATIGDSIASEDEAEQDGEDATGHEDVADHLEVDSLDGVRSDGEGEDRPDDEQRDAESDVDGVPLVLTRQGPRLGVRR